MDRRPVKFEPDESAYQLHCKVMTAIEKRECYGFGAQDLLCGGLLSK